MKKLPQISEAEYEVMKIVWKYAPINTNEITEKLTRTTSYEKHGRIFVYSPLVKENEYIGQESSSFLNRYYNGDITAMLSSYIENDRLSDSEIATLRSILSNGRGGQ